jgi:hypothetical protein
MPSLRVLFKFHKFTKCASSLRFCWVCNACDEVYACYSNEGLLLPVLTLYLNSYQAFIWDSVLIAGLLLVVSPSRGPHYTD